MQGSEHPASDWEERRLVACLQVSGEGSPDWEQAAEILYTRYIPFVKTVIRRRVFHEQQAEDLASEAMLAALLRARFFVYQDVHSTFAALARRSMR